MKKRGRSVVLLVLNILILTIILPHVSANFVCGLVHDSEEVSASWFEVSIYYEESPNHKTNCQVSPENNKFCCDPQNIDQVSWGIGKTVIAEISDNQKSYFTNPESLEITGEGFDIFSDMQLKKAITINSPNTTLFINTSEVVFNVTLEEEFNNLRYTLNNSLTTHNHQVCLNCTQILFTIQNFSFGKNSLILTAFSNTREINKTIDLTILNYLNFNREVDCRGCRRNFVPTNRLVNITLSLESSHSIEGELKDIFPKDWQFIQGGSKSDYSDTHNLVSWEINGSAKKTYTLLSPNKIATRRYSFKLGFEDIFDKEYISILYRWRIFRYSLIAFGSRFSASPFQGIQPIVYEKYNTISPNNPIVLDVNDSTLIQAAIFPNSQEENIIAFAHNKAATRLRRANAYFTIGTDLEENAINQTFIKFRVEKPSLQNQILGDVTLYQYQEGIWNEILAEKQSENEEEVIFTAISEKTGNFAVIREYERKVS